MTPHEIERERSVRFWLAAGLLVLAFELGRRGHTDLALLCVGIEILNYRLETQHIQSLTASLPSELSSADLIGGIL